jgi:hypothetical protein
MVLWVLASGNYRILLLLAKPFRGNFQMTLLLNGNHRRHRQTFGKISWKKCLLL